MTILYDMAKKVIRTTYSLDVETVETLRRLARAWGVSRSEALRRAVARTAAEPASTAEDRLGALRDVQESVGLTPAQADEWLAELRSQRDAWDPPTG